MKSIILGALLALLSPLSLADDECHHDKYDCDEYEHMEKRHHKGDDHMSDRYRGNDHHMREDHNRRDDMHRSGHKNNRHHDKMAYLVSPEDGSTVTSPVHIVFGLKGMGVAPAGVEKENTGHHHLIIDADAGDFMNGKPLPSNHHVRHFGGGQTQTTLELSPGKHTLQLLMGNHKHMPHKPAVMSEKITIMVSE